MPDKSRMAACLRGCLAAFVLFSFASGCAIKAVRPAVFGDEKSGTRVLIAADASDFKGEVVKQVIEKLTQKGAFVRLVPLSDLSGMNDADYRAVVLINTVIAWQAKPDAAAFIKKSQNREKIILISTAGGSDFSANYEGVDAVTAASEMQDAGALSDKIVEKVEKLL